MADAWSEERIARLKALVADGLSASKIADALGGVSRCGVIGKVHRLGLSLKGTATGSAEAWIAARQQRAKQLRATRDVKPRKGGVRSFKVATPSFDAAEPFAPAEEIEIPVEQRKTLMQLDAHTCRWPVGDPATDDFYFCGGAPDGERPYCAHHCRVAYQPPGQRRSRPAFRDGARRHG